ncbi:MAG: copper chaperone PCu(A)C [Oricola sp.]|nr:copper chaperone PCu(A)C [Oricola sp.]
MAGCRRLFAFPLAVLFFAHEVFAGEPHASTATGILSVEHAQILLPIRGGELTQGFLTIWNSSGETVYLKTIESPDFAVVRVTPEKIGESGLWIPAESELAMKPGGLQLVLEEPIREMQPGQTVQLRFETGIGNKIVIDADTVASRMSLTDHHHGDGDRPFEGN